jgi:hypothetical protein
MATPSSAFRLAGTSAPGASGFSYEAFNDMFKSLPKDFNLGLQSTMTPPNPQDNFLSLGLTKEEALKADPMQVMVFGMQANQQANRQKEDIYNDPNLVRKLLGVYGEFQQGQAEKAQKMKLQSQAFQGLLDIPKTIASVYSTIPAMYLAGRQAGGFNTIPRRTSFQ